jgi:hypothetical protein
MFLIHTPPEHAETVARAVVGLAAWKVGNRRCSHSYCTPFSTACSVKNWISQKSSRYPPPRWRER